LSTCSSAFHACACRRADAEAHAKILAAIERQDPDQAAKAVLGIMTSIGTRLVELNGT
jgi:DNA-binding FadR family transcriptional regulator